MNNSEKTENDNKKTQRNWFESHVAVFKCISSAFFRQHMFDTFFLMQSMAPAVKLLLHSPTNEVR